MQDQDHDNDIAGDGQEDQPVHSGEARHDTHDFGQMARRAPSESSEKVNRPGFLGRLFGRTSKKPERSDRAKPAAKSDDWAPLDLSKGFYRDEHLYRQNTQAVARHLREEFKSVLPKFSVRNDLAKRLAPKKGKGFSRKEFRNTLEDMKKEGKLTRSQARRAIGRFKAYK